MLRATTSYDFGIVRIGLNGKTVADCLDPYPARLTVKKVDLGRRQPKSNTFVIRCELIERNPSGRGARTYFGLDSIIIDQIE